MNIPLSPEWVSRVRANPDGFQNPITLHACAYVCDSKDKDTLDLFIGNNNRWSGYCLSATLNERMVLQQSLNLEL